MSMIPPEIVKRLVEERLKGSSFKEISELIEKEFGRKIDPTTLNKVVNKEFTRLPVYAAESDIVPTIDSNEVVQNLLKEKTEKMKSILDHLFKVMDNMRDYEEKIMQWLDKLESDLEANYVEIKKSGSIPSINKITQIQNALEKTKNMIKGDVEEYRKMLELYYKLVEVSKTSDVKINKLDISYMVNQNIVNIEKMGYMMIMPKSTKAKDAIKQLEKEGEITIYSGV